MVCLTVGYEGIRAVNEEEHERTTPGNLGTKMRQENNGTTEGISRTMKKGMLKRVDWARN